MKARPVSDTHLHGNWLVIARVAWFIVVGATLALFVLSIPVGIAQSQTVCNDPVVNNCFNLGQLTPQLLQELEQMGLSPSFYVVYTAILEFAFPLVFLVIGTLIFWRKSNDWIALLVSLMLVVFGVGNFASTPNLLPLAYSSLTLPTLLLQFLGVALMMFFIFLFPDGLFVPRWIVWLIPFILLREGINTFLPNSDLVNGTPWFVLQLVEVASALYAQIYRYRRVSGPVQRQQTKWVVYGLVMAFIGYFGLISLFVIGFTGWATNVLAVLFLKTLLPSFVLLIPLSILIAILRSRLWDIDIIIRRTLVYGVLTGMLVLLFNITEIVVQQLVGRITGQSSEIAIILSTLAIAALFNPLRKRIQDVVDRRFYRRKYDAQKVLAQFAQTARDETDLNKLTDELIRVVDETMQPESVSVWLKETEKKR